MSLNRKKIQAHLFNTFSISLDKHLFVSDECLSRGDNHYKWTKAED